PSSWRRNDLPGPRVRLRDPDAGRLPGRLAAEASPPLTRVVVVGGGPAAHGAVAGLRRAGFSEEIVLVGREKDPPYQRPPLSKKYLAGELPREQLPLPPLDASLRLGEEVTEIDPRRHEVRLAGGERVGYSRLLLATGSQPRPLSGHEGEERVLYLRELADA